MTRMRIALPAVAVAVIAAACGGGASSSTSSAPAASPGKTITISTRQLPNVGSVLVDARGMSLYQSDQEAGGKVLCTGSCTKLWIPLEAPSGGGPVAAAGLKGKVGVVDRPDGVTQVTFEGVPLYTFFQDSAPGDVNGNGQSDSFGGTNFTWKAATAGAPAKMNDNGNSGSNSGYGY